MTPFICRVHCDQCGRMWVFDARYINPAEYSCLICSNKESPMNKKLTVTHKDGTHKEVHAVSIEAALKDLAKDIKHGNVEVPCTLEFDGPNGLRFTVTVANEEQAGAISTMGFMF